ncbi:MAG: hypothetical protein EOO15_01960 [Chitinophagaceae bacterium]|nr:MAG: hypothetical protein EOO15_01960 [Chitinophagaceae bacterium]
MDELLQMVVTLLFLPLALLGLFYLALSLRQLTIGFQESDLRKQRNSVYLIAICFLALVLLHRFWVWLMWQLD